MVGGFGGVSETIRRRGPVAGEDFHRFTRVDE